MRNKQVNLRRALRRTRKPVHPRPGVALVEKVGFWVWKNSQPFILLLSLVTAYSAGLLYELPQSFHPLAGLAFVSEQVAVLAATL